MDLYASIPKESRQSAVIKEFQALILNLYCGIRLLGFRRNVLEQVTVSHDQLILLLGFYGLTALIVSYVMTRNPVFDLFGLGFLSIELLIVLLVGFVLTKLTGKQSDLLKFLVITYCVLPFRYLISFAGLSDLPDTIFAAGYVIFMLWSLAICFYIALQLLDQQKLKAALIVMLWMAASFPLANLSFSFWYEDYDYPNEMAAFSDDALYDVNQEHVYYNQPMLLNNALDPIQPGIDGVSDLFFVGFGSDATQDVFMREIGHVQRVMSERLGASGRSIVLLII